MIGKVKPILKKLYGHPCWHAGRGYGSALLFDFGRPTLEIGKIMEPVASQPAGYKHHYRIRSVRVRGEWRILIDCCGWLIAQDNDKLARWTSSKKRIDRVLRIIEGQALSQIDVEPNGSLTTFEFDLGARLHTFPYSEEIDDHWVIFHSKKAVLKFGVNGLQALG